MPARPRAANLQQTEKARPPLPQITKDPVASLQPWPLEFTHSGKTFHIPALSASAWLPHLLVDQLDLENMLLELVDEGPTLLELDSLSQEEFEELCLDVLEAVGGRPWWITLRLAVVAKSQWNIIGAELMLYGADPSRMSLSGWLDVLFLVTANMIDNDKITMFYSLLEMPPPSVAATLTEDDMVMSREAFLAIGR